VRAARESLGLSQVEFASRGGGVHATRLGEIERGEHPYGLPRPVTLRTIEDAAGWSPGDSGVILAGGEPTPRGSAREPYAVTHEDVTTEHGPVRVVVVEVPASADRLTPEERRAAAERIAHQYPPPSDRADQPPGRFAQPA
jgi:transcriptional regulator with XRE-family HTH domain